MEENETREPAVKKQKDYALPASIVLAAILISGSLVYTTGKRAATNEKLAGNVAGLGESAVSPAKVQDLREDDHILGNPESEVKVIEFADLECPFCKHFHETMKQVVAAYPGKVAWIYRHFPLDIHPKAMKEAEAAECAAELGGNSAFWAYVDKIFEVTPSNNGLDLNLLPQIAERLGLDRNKFETCLKEGKRQDRVVRDAEEAITGGARGTPYSVVVAKNGKRLVIPGALPYETSNPGESSVKAIIEEALRK